MIAAIVPAHNEEGQIPSCLAALRAAARCPRLGGEQTILVVVLDDCTDNTRSLAQRLGVTTIALNARNVGAARVLGAQLAVAAGARWLAFTDADTQVAADWIAAQLALRSDAVCGTVAVGEWESYGDDMRRHCHIHGANFGVSARAYERAGGHSPLEGSENVALVKALQASRASIAWSAAPRVFASVRRLFRAPGGFGATMARVAQENQQRRLEVVRRDPA